ncbi:hypothetical protein Acr_09g0008500 [Actinidia rufa]|uniref:Uncharacterized protein n=1 Tax=Actinidia rufa TaxID=165716 RepID=A0A7J0F6T4_9ERIC|nr:hypothetical protein Acr_09g0008500 [Actinidia rufa]
MVLENCPCPHHPTLPEQKPSSPIQPSPDQRDITVTATLRQSPFALEARCRSLVVDRRRAHHAMVLENCPCPHHPTLPEQKPSSPIQPLPDQREITVTSTLRQSPFALEARRRSLVVDRRRAHHAPLLENDSDSLLSFFLSPPAFHGYVRLN